MKNHHGLVVATAITLLAGACGGGGTASPTTPRGGSAAGPSLGRPSAPVTLTFWHGYTDVEADWLNAAIAEWNAQNPTITVKPLFVNNDKALQKLTVALQGGEPPDITYQYGSSLPQVASAPGLVDLTRWVQQPDVHWDDFVP